MTLSMDTQLQNFWVESINKEATLRFGWHLRYSKQFARTSTAQNAAHGKRQASKKKHGLALNSSVTERIQKMEEQKKPRPKSLSDGATSRATSVAMKDTRLTKSADGAATLRDMRPPSSNTRALLYNGISAHGEGRYAYLKKRRTLTPEEKYEFPILSSCQYGWKIMEYTKPKSSPHARTCVIKDSFYRNSGVIIE